MSIDPTGTFSNASHRALQDIPCTGNDATAAWRSDKPLTAGQLAAYKNRDATKDEFRPEAGDWISVHDAEIEDGFLVVVGIPVADYDVSGEE